MLSLRLHTKIGNIVDVMCSGRNKVSKEFSSGQYLPPLGALQLFFLRTPG